MLLGKRVLRIFSKFKAEQPCRSSISVKLFCNFIEITFRRGCSPVNLEHIFRSPFLKNTFGWLLLNYWFTEFINKILKNIYVLEFQFWLKVILLNMINIEYVDNSHDSNLKKTVSRISKAFKQTRQTNLVHDRR